MAIWIDEATVEGVVQPSGTSEALHRIVGGLEVAREIVGRSRGLYVAGTAAPDDGVLSCLAIVTDILGRVVEGLDQPRLGPAA